MTLMKYLLDEKTGFCADLNCMIWIILGIFLFINVLLKLIVTLALTTFVYAKQEQNCNHKWDVTTGYFCY